MLRLTNQTNYILQCTFTRGTQSTRINRTPQIDRSAKDGIARQLRYRIGLTRQVGFIRRALSFDHLGIHREQSPRLDHHHITDIDRSHRHFTLVAGRIAKNGKLWRRIKQAIDLTPRAVERKMLQRTGKGKQEEQQCAFRPRTNRSRSYRDCQH